jgi:hypothetical protein
MRTEVGELEPRLFGRRQLLLAQASFRADQELDRGRPVLLQRSAEATRRVTYESHREPLAVSPEHFLQRLQLLDHGSMSAPGDSRCIVDDIPPSLQSAGAASNAALRQHGYDASNTDLRSEPHNTIHLVRLAHRLD